MAHYEHSGSAPDTTLVGDITSTSTAITIADGTGWPTGAGGKFWVAIDPDTASEEHLLVNARSGTALTLVSAADRGLDGTAAQDHDSDAPVRHIWSAVEADDVALQSAANTFAGVCTFTQNLLAKAATNRFGPNADGSGGGEVLLTADGTWSYVKAADVTGNQGLILRPQGDGTIELQNSVGTPLVGVGLVAGSRALGFFDKADAPINKPALTGSRGGNAAVASIATVLDALGLATNSTTA